MLALLVSCWPIAGHAEIAPGFEPTVELLPPEGASGSGPNEQGGVNRPEPGFDPIGPGGWGPAPGSVEPGTAGTGLFGGASFEGDLDPEHGGFRNWLIDRLVGVGKGLVAGVIGAAVVVLVAGLFVTSVPGLLVIGGSALLGGALYGLFVGGRNFNWVEAVVGAVLSGASAGVGWWLNAAARPLATKIGVVVADVVASGISSLTSYLVHSPERSWRGALWAFSLGGLTAGVFTGAGAVVGRVWKWGWGGLRFLPDQEPNAKAMVAAALSDTLPKPAISGQAHAAAPRNLRKHNGLIPGTPAHKAWRWELYQQRGGKLTYEQWSKRYDTGINNARKGLQREQQYREYLGGENKILTFMLPDGTEIVRQVDIYIPEKAYAGQLKTGRESLTAANRDAIWRDSFLVKSGITVEWILEQGGSKPLIEALQEAGIKVRIGPQLPRGG